MAYQVEYSAASAVRKSIKVQRKLPKKKIAIAVAAVLLALTMCIPAAREALIPGNKEVTKVAVGTLIEQIRNGEGVVDAFAEFCQQIIQSS